MVDPDQSAISQVLIKITLEMNGFFYFKSNANVINQLKQHICIFTYDAIY